MPDEVKLLPCDEPMERALIAGRQAWKACREADGYSDDHVVTCIVRAAIEATRPTEQGLGAIPGSHPSDQAPSGLGASRFDPERGA